MPEVPTATVPSERVNIAWFNGNGFCACCSHVVFIVEEGILRGGKALGFPRLMLEKR